MIAEHNRNNTDRRAGATVVSHQCDTGPYYKESSISPSSSGHGNLRVVEVETSALRQARRRRTGRFLRGPIPMSDIAAAARLPGKALAVYIALHHRAALTRSKAAKLPRALLADLGVDKHGKARALSQLEAAGLISVRRQTGRSPVIELRSTNIKPEPAE